MGEVTLNWLSELNWFGGAGALVGGVIVLVLMRVFLLWPNIVIQLDKVDRPVGRIQYIKLFVCYLKDPDRLQKSIDL